MDREVPLCEGSSSLSAFAKGSPRLDTIKKQHEEQMKLVQKYKSDLMTMMKGNREDFVVRSLALLP